MSLSKNKVKYIHSLKDKKNRSKYKTFVAEGDKMVRELLNILPCELLIGTAHFLKDIENINDLEIGEIIEVAETDISKVSFVKHPQQTIAVFYQKEYSVDLSVLKNQLFLALDGIQDPGNLGTIVRLADWYGIENIFCSEDTADIYNPKVIQATMGAIARVKIHYLNLPHFFDQLVDIPIYGTFLDGSNMYETVLSDIGCIVMGNEGNGIRPEVENKILNRLFIPNYPFDRQTSESLNVAIATSIICSEFRRSKFIKK